MAAMPSKAAEIIRLRSVRKHSAKAVCFSQRDNVVRPTPMDSQILSCDSPTANNAMDLACFDVI